MKSKFAIIDNKGFQLTFKNGFTISCVFGAGNYCENRNKKHDEKIEVSKDAEIAIYDESGEWLRIQEYDNVKGYISTDELAFYIQAVQRATNLEHLKDVIELENLKITFHQ